MSKKLLVKIRDAVSPDLTRDVPENGILSVGSDSSANLRLNDERIAPEQFVILCERGEAILMCHADGVQINKQNLPQGARHNLQPGDAIIVGDYTLVFDFADTIEKARSENFAANAATAEKQIAARQNTPARVKNSAANGSLNDVLEELRADEKFYFQVENAVGDERRFYVESEEMWLGWSPAGECVIGVNTAEIEIPRAQIRKDWSGVVLYPLQTQAIRINAEIVSEPHRLKNDDRLILLGKDKENFAETVSVRFHEPTALLILDSILPKKLPPPVSLANAAQFAETKQQNVAATEAADAKQQATQPIARATVPSIKRRRFFGYFTFAEIILMILGTLIASVIIFLVLQYF